MVVLGFTEEVLFKKFGLTYMFEELLQLLQEMFVFAVSEGDESFVGFMYTVCEDVSFVDFKFSMLLLSEPK